MRIGFDLAQACSPPLAGCGWYAQTLLETMAPMAPNGDFLAYRHFGQWFNRQENLAPWPSSVNIRDPLAGYTPDATVTAWQEALANHEAPGRPDLVHSTSFQAPRLTASKLVVTIFDLSFWTVPEFTTDHIRLNCQAGVLAALEYADGLIFISEHTRSEFDKLLPDYRRKGAIATTVTPLASRWDMQPTVPTRSGEYWLFVGSLEPRKNILNLLNAYEVYVKNHPSPKPLWFAGGRGWKNESIRAKIETLETRGLVRNLGYVTDRSLLELYQNAHALIFPSWYEGFGLPVLEAMTLGCPVICSDRTSLPEVGGDAVRYIDPANPQTITQAMLQLENAPMQRIRLIEQAKVQSAKFSWKQTAELTLAFYDQILSAH